MVLMQFVSVKTKGIMLYRMTVNAVTSPMQIRTDHDQIANQMHHNR